MTPEIQTYIEDQIRMHIHDGNYAQAIQLINLFGYIETVTQVPSVAPQDFYGQFKIYSGVLYYYDFLNSVWRSTAFVANSFTGYGTGTAYSLTNTAALLDFGTTDPSVTLTIAGTYLISGRVRLDYNAATFAAVRTATLKFRRTNNTAADLTSGSTSFKTQIITTLTYTAGIIPMPDIIYTTANSDDIIQVYGSVDTIPSAGTFDAVEATIVCLRIA